VVRVGIREHPVLARLEGGDAVCDLLRVVQSHVAQLLQLGLGHAGLLEVADGGADSCIHVEGHDVDVVPADVALEHLLVDVEQFDVQRVQPHQLAQQRFVQFGEQLHLRLIETLSPGLGLSGQNVVGLHQ